MEEGLLPITVSLRWIALMLTLHVLFKDCNGGSAIRKLEETIMRQHIGDQLARISEKLDKISEKIDKMK